LARYRLTKSQNWWVTLICIIPLLIGFIIPVMQMTYWSILTFSSTVNSQFWNMAFNSFLVAGLTSFIAVGICFFLIYAVYLNQSKFSSTLTRAAHIGYAVPGAVIAIGVFLPILALDKSIIEFSKNFFNYNGGLILSGSIFILVYGYVVRFIAVSYNPIEDGYKKVGWQMTEASRVLGIGTFKTLFRVNFPLLKTALLSGALLVFVDVMKELPLTLILRPFNFHTLATKTFELASDEMIAESANAALIIVLTGIIPIFVLSKLISKQSYS
jgi:iron(III) transport system permease protein